MKPLLALALSCLVVTTALAQPAAGPAPELAKYERLLGNWSGAGVAMMGQGLPPQKWTSRSRVTRVLGGHFFREEMVIEIPGPMAFQIAYLNFHAYDTEKKRFVSYSVSNSGQLTTSEVFFPDENTLVTMGTGREDGSVMAERWTIAFRGEEQHLEAHRLDLVGGLKVTIKGVMRRQKEPVKIDLHQIAFLGAGPGAKPAPELKPLLKMAGLYEVEGKYRMSAEQELTEFGGTELIRGVFGGCAITNESSGEGYEGFGMICWDAEEKKLRRVSLSSWGLHHLIDAQMEGDKHLVYRFNDLMMGQHVMVRTVMETNEDGHAVRAWSDALMGMAPPLRSYEGEFTFLAPAPGTKGARGGF